MALDLDKPITAKTPPEQLKEIAAQLSCPTGQPGVKIAEMMEANNVGMIMETIKAMGFQNHQTILEIGHGNCAHLAVLLGQAQALRYHGLDISDLMKSEAERLNKFAIEEKKATFHLYDGKSLPFEDQMFDQVMTVNTLYFWTEPIAMFHELHRVLKNGGTCCVTYAQKDFMEKLPFCDYGFELYNDQKALELVSKTPFAQVEVVARTEMLKNPDGAPVARPFSLLLAKR